ncbi:RNA-directed DNA polymerase [bacterium]|nr:RNA-directed DNA polymerase [bacterium]
MKLYQKKFASLYSEIELKKSFRQKIISKDICGLDGISNEKFRLKLKNEISTVNKKVLSGSYKFTPFLEKLLIKRKNAFPRQIAIPSKRDQLVLFQLKEFLKYTFKDNLATRLPNEYIQKILEFMNSNIDDLNQYILIKSDIVGFYDNINKEKLMNKLRDKISESSDKHILKLLYQAISNYIVPKNYHKANNYLYLNSSGIPQGLAISNILADIYLSKFDTLISRESQLYLRYVDDFLIIADKAKLKKLLNIISKKMKKISLELHQEKTSINDLSITFDYLGYKIKKNLISVRRSSVESQIRKIAFHFKHMVPIKTEDKILNEENSEVFIEDLNELITGAISNNKRYGWLFYYSRINDLSVLYELDRIVNKFFKRSEYFDYIVNPKRKRYVTAYFRMRKKNAISDTYFHNYEIYNTKYKRIEYLRKRHIVDSKTAMKMNAEEVLDIFNKYKEKRLKNLEKDDHKDRY